MNKRFFIIATTAAMLSPLSAFAQAPRAERTDAAGAKNWTAPRTPWGEPDLQGTYSNRTITPFERPANVAGREFFTQEEVAALGHIWVRRAIAAARSDARGDGRGRLSS